MGTVRRCFFVPKRDLAIERMKLIICCTLWLLSSFIIFEIVSMRQDATLNS